MFKKGDVVRAKVTVPQGPIVKMRMDDDGNVEYLVINIQGKECSIRVLLSRCK